MKRRPRFRLLPAAVPGIHAHDCAARRAVRRRIVGAACSRVTSPLLATALLMTMAAVPFWSV